MEKVCSRCGIKKTIDNFYPNRNKCKECLNSLQKILRLKKKNNKDDIESQYIVEGESKYLDMDIVNEIIKNNYKSYNDNLSLHNPIVQLYLYFDYVPNKELLINKLKIFTKSIVKYKAIIKCTDIDIEDNKYVYCIKMNY